MNRLTKHYIQQNAQSVAKTFAAIHAETESRLAEIRRLSMKSERLETDYIAASRPGRPVGSAGGQTRTQRHGSHLAKYQTLYGMIAEVSRPCDDYGMADNAPLWTMGEALASRDSIAA
jgi:hypothetical protein